MKFCPINNPCGAKTLLGNDENSNNDCYPKSQGYWKTHLNDPTWTELNNCVSNEFNEDKYTWEFIDPLNDSSYNITGGKLTINVPTGDHDPYTTFKAPRYVTSTELLDDVNNFELEVKMLSVMNQKYQIQGIAIEEDSSNYIRVEAFHDGTRTHIYVQPTLNGINQPALNITPFGNGLSPVPLWLRVQRINNSWICKYSTDGNTFTSLAPKIVNLNLQNIGVYAGNAVGVSSPSHTAIFEYFRDINCISGEGPDTIFFLSEKTWIEVLETSSEGNNYYILAKQYIAAKLNVLAGASGLDINYLLAAETVFNTYTPYNFPSTNNIQQIKYQLELFNTSDC